MSKFSNFNFPLQLDNSDSGSGFRYDGDSDYISGENINLENSSGGNLAAGRNITFKSESSVAFGRDITLNNSSESSVNLGFNLVSNGISLLIGSYLNGGNQTIGIGSESTVDGENGIGIGNVVISNSRYSIAIGQNATVESPLGSTQSGIAIGKSALVDLNGDRGIAVGESSKATTFSISMGYLAETTATGAIAIGTASKVTASSAFQLGNGTNTERDTLQFKNVRLANAEGLYTSFTSPVNYAPTDTDNVTSHFAAIDTALGNNTGSIYVDDNFTGIEARATGVDSFAVGEVSNATGTRAIAIGRTSKADGSSSIAIGSSSRSDLFGGVAIGLGANSSGEYSIQLGSGYNTADSTLQFLNNRLANTKGLVTSFTNPTNYSPVDTDNVTSHLQAIDEKLGQTEVPTFHRTNRQDLSSNISLNNTSNGIQHLLNKTGMVLTINLPSSPIKDVHFIVKNRVDSTDALYINDITLQPGEMWNGIYDGVEWMEL